MWQRAPKAALAGLAPSSPSSTPPQFPLHHLLGVFPLIDSEDLPSTPEARTGSSSCPEYGKERSTGYRHRAERASLDTRTVFHPTGNLLGQSKGNDGFQETEARTFFLEADCASSCGAGAGGSHCAMLGPEAFLRKRNSSAGRDKSQRDESWPPAQDAPAPPPQRRSPSGWGVAPGCHHRHLLTPDIRKDRAGVGVNKVDWNRIKVFCMVQNTGNPTLGRLVPQTCSAPRPVARLHHPHHSNAGLRTPSERPPHRGEDGQQHTVLEYLSFFLQ